MDIRDVAHKAAYAAHPNGVMNLELVNEIADAVAVAVLREVEKRIDPVYLVDLLAAFTPAEPPTPDAEAEAFKAVDGLLDRHIGNYTHNLGNMHPEGYGLVTFKQALAAYRAQKGK